MPQGFIESSYFSQILKAELNDVKVPLGFYFVALCG